MASLIEVSSSKCFSGQQKRFTHQSKSCDCPMNFTMFVPPKALEGTKCPVLYYLAGRGCTEQTVTTTGFQRYAAEHGLIVVSPDTSPRNVVEGDTDNPLVGSGVSYYLNATTERWKKHYQMFTYVTEELIELIETSFEYVLKGRRGIFGHSMGGHGALLCLLKKPSLYQSVSALAPVCNFTNSPRTARVLNEYFGDDKDIGKHYDPTELVKNYEGPSLEILIDVGTSDPLINVSLLPWNFIQALPPAKVSCYLRLQDGYEHSNLFVTTFMKDHIEHHAKTLNAKL